MMPMRALRTPRRPWLESKRLRAACCRTEPQGRDHRCPQDRLRRRHAAQYGKAPDWIAPTPETPVPPVLHFAGRGRPHTRRRRRLARGLWGLDLSGSTRGELWQHYLHQYGRREKDQGGAVVRLRKNAVLTPSAVMRKSLHVADDLAFWYLMKPLRRSTCAWSTMGNLRDRPAHRQSVTRLSPPRRDRSDRHRYAASWRVRLRSCSRRRILERP